MIGCRATTELYPKLLHDEFFRQVDELASKADIPRHADYSNDFINQNRKKLDRIWQQLGGKFASPLTRNPKRTLGEEDNACVVDQQLAERLGACINDDKQYDQSWWISHWGKWDFVPIVYRLGYDSATLARIYHPSDLAGQYWAVVIECHK